MKVSGEELRGALTTFGLVARGRLGRAVWSAAHGTLSVAWAGITVDLVAVSTIGPGAPTAAVRNSVSADVMKALVAAPPLGDDVDVDLTDSRLRVGTLVVPAEPVSAAAPDHPVDSGLPVGATDRDMLVAARRGSTQLGAELAIVEKRLAGSIAAAAEALDWLGIDEGALEAFVEACLADKPIITARASVPARVSGDGQLALELD